MKIIVTGGRGYIGTKLVERLGCNSFDLVDGQDFRKELDCYELSKYDLVIHLGAISDVQLCQGDKNLAFETNVIGTVNVLKYAKKIIFTSSAAVYGDNDSKVNISSEINPISYYGHTKVLGEKLIGESNIDSTVFRIFNIYGYDGKSVMDIFERNNTLKVYGDSVRDFIHLDKVIDRIVQEVQSIKGKFIHNLGSGIPIKIVELAESMNKPIEYLPSKEHDIKFSCSDNGSLL